MSQLTEQKVEEREFVHVQTELGVPVAGHGVVGLLRQGVEGGVPELAGINEGGVEELELLLGDHAGAASVDCVKQSLGIILEPHREISKLPSLPNRFS